MNVFLVNTHPLKWKNAIMRGSLCIFQSFSSAVVGAEVSCELFVLAEKTFARFPVSIKSDTILWHVVSAVFMASLVQLGNCWRHLKGLSSATMRG